MTRMIMSGIGGGLVCAFLSQIVAGSGGTSSGGFVAAIWIFAIGGFILGLATGSGFGGGCVCAIVLPIAMALLVVLFEHVPMWVSVAIGLVGGSVPWIPRLKKEREEERKRLEQDERDRIEAEQKRRKAEEEMRQKWDEEARKKRQEIAAEFKGTTLPSMLSRCENNMQISETWELHPNYEASTLQRDVWVAVDEASVPLQRLVDIVNELKAAEGK